MRDHPGQRFSGPEHAGPLRPRGGGRRPVWAYDKQFQYSQAVRAGNLLLLAGQCPVDAQGHTVAAGDIRGQTRQVFENLKAVLAAVGLTLDL